ncbi:glutamic-type intramembrane protease PrsW [Neobacillus sp. LXY-4]|uniref:glutamic-type intramembrane protease PrsW n=1 Tax=Neobacillus sp. LXY-4 TaxID=3379826 RepID=UPI003EE35C3E
MLGILSAGIAPGLALLVYFYLKDQYGSEPISVVFKTFLFGAILVFPIAFIQYVFETENLGQSGMIHAFVLTGFLEEFVKWFVLIYTVYQHVAFDEPYDGIVYGAAVSLGFATAENILFLFANGLEHAIGRAFLPVSSHALFGVIMGFYIGKSKFMTISKRKWLSLSLILPFILHGIYDYILLNEQKWAMMILPFMLFLWWLGIRKVKRARYLSAIHYESKFNIEKTRLSTK